MDRYLDRPFVTQTVKAVGALPAGLSGSAIITHTTMEGPIEKFLGYLVGTASQSQIEFVIYAALALAAYVAEKEEKAAPATAHKNVAYAAEAK